VATGDVLCAVDNALDIVRGRGEALCAGRCVRTLENRLGQLTRLVGGVEGLGRAACGRRLRRAVQRARALQTQIGRLAHTGGFDSEQRGLLLTSEVERVRVRAKALSQSYCRRE
jgi:hypothetical protein